MAGGTVEGVEQGKVTRWRVVEGVGRLALCDARRVGVGVVWLWSCCRVFK